MDVPDHVLLRTAGHVPDVAVSSRNQARFAKTMVLSIFWPVTLVYFLVRKVSKPSGVTQQA